MKRRTFLRMLSLAPVAAAVPAMAMPRPENVKETVKGSVTMGDQAGMDTGMHLSANGNGVTRIVIQEDQPLIFKGGKLWINPANIDVPMYGPPKHGDDFYAWAKAQ